MIMALIAIIKTKKEEKMVRNKSTESILDFVSTTICSFLFKEAV